MRGVVLSAALPTVRLANSTWRKSSRSNQGGTNGNCVEVAVVSPVIADPRNTSRTCPRKDCGHVAEENRPTQEKFQCVRCGYTDHADRVGALNIAIRAGLVLPDLA
jgi:hypothetical protein